MATIDVLGEEISSRRETLEIVRAYHDVFEAIEREQLDSNVSVKLTALGLNLAYELAGESREGGSARRRERQLRSDRHGGLQLHERHAAPVPRAARSRSRQRRRRPSGLPPPDDQDIRELAPSTPNVPLLQGIYVESPLIAYRDYEEVSQNFILSLRELLRGTRTWGSPPHDAFLISEGCGSCRRRTDP